MMHSLGFWLIVGAISNVPGPIWILFGPVVLMIMVLS